MAHGYRGLNFREVAQEVGIKNASIYYHFVDKADLGAAVAKRYWEDTKVDLEALLAKTADPAKCLRQYPDMFRRSLQNDNRLCLASFMGSQYDDLPDTVRKEAQIFADVNIAWLSKVLSASAKMRPRESVRRARAIFAAVAGAQLIARSRSDISLFDELIASYRATGLLPV